MQYKQSDFLNQIFKHWRKIQLTGLPFIVFGLFAVYWLVHTTGGAKYVYSHSMYLVILLGGFLFGIGGGVLVGLLGGIVIGPFMPIDVATGEAQGTLNWTYRMVFFTLAGFISGVISDGMQSYITRLQYFMRHDETSGLYNRFALLEKLENINSSYKWRSYSILAVVALENSDELESAYGPVVIDHIIGHLAERFKRVSSTDIRFYRTNAKHLAALIPKSQEGDVRQLLQSFIDEGSYPVEFNDIRLHTDIRLGYTDLDRMTGKAGWFLRKAELAIRRAHLRSQSIVEFSPEMEASNTNENIALLGQLKSALEGNQVSLHYQPKVNIKTGVVNGVEALMRWHHPTLGDIPPGKFIPRAEQSTLIKDLTHWALETAITQLVVWQRNNIPLTIAVNISTQNLQQPDFVDSVLGLLAQHGVEAHFLELEVTEGAFMHDLEGNVAKLSLLAKAGIKLSIDDFGTGYSSLQYLNYLPVTHIKIDRSFIQTLSQQSGSAPIVKAIVNACHDMGMEVVAEGVEEVDSYQFLNSLGCETAQGYLISRPMPVRELDRWLESNRGVFQLP